MNGAEGFSLQEIEQAGHLLDGIIHRTPLLPSRSLAERCGGEIYLKAENLQRTGSFKIRGAYNRLIRLTEEEKRRGVVAVSAGNHAQGVAWAAAKLGVHATVFMPEDASIAKVEATKAYGAEVRLQGLNFDDAAKRAHVFAAETGASLIHAFDDPEVIAGQGTLALELLEELPDCSYMLVPIGGGGLMAGVATAVKSVRPRIRLIGVESDGSASVSPLLSGNRPRFSPGSRTIADGLAVKYPSKRTLQTIEKHVDELLIVREESIPSAILFLLERARLVVEGAGAVGVAAILEGQLKNIAPGNKGIALLTGGNIDMNLLARIVQHGLVAEGRFLQMRLRVDDRPGSLQALLGEVARLGANVLTVEHDRLHSDVSFGEAEITLTLETRNEDHRREIQRRLEKSKF